MTSLQHLLERVKAADGPSRELDAAAMRQPNRSPSSPPYSRPSSHSPTPKAGRGGAVSAIFVFGSNLAGRHGKGAALAARKEHGAEYGVGIGRTGNAYAIPTKDKHLQSLSLGEIERHVIYFINYAWDHPDLAFNVTAIGCGLAGYKPEQIAPFFRSAPNNCALPAEFIAVLANPEGRTA